MTTDFVAPVLALALHVIASSVGKPPGEKVCFSRRKNRVSLYLQKKNRSPESSNCLSSGACAFILLLSRLYKVDM